MKKSVDRKKQKQLDREKKAQDKKNRKFVNEEVFKQLPLIKKRIRAAAQLGNTWIDEFPTGAIGDNLLILLGPGFRANTDEYSYKGESDGQGSVDYSTYQSHTRLMWNVHHD